MSHDVEETIKGGLRTQPQLAKVFQNTLTEFAIVYLEEDRPSLQC